MNYGIYSLDNNIALDRERLTSHTVQISSFARRTDFQNAAI
jgi:hypothetical protein